MAAGLIVVGSGWALAGAWIHIWASGSPETAMAIAAVPAAVLPVVDAATIPAIVLGTVFGIALPLPLDSYKRGQGTIALLGALIAVSRLFAAEVRILPTPIALGSGAIGIGVGVFLSDLPSTLASGGTIDLTEGFRRFRRLVLAIGVLAVVDSTLAYAAPIAAAGGQVVLGVPTLYRVESPMGLVAGLAGVAVLAGVLTAFHRYDLTRDVFILGPQRAGKTFFIGAMAYAIKADAIASPAATPVDIPPPLGGPHSLYEKFQRGKYEEVGTTDTDEANVYELTFPHGRFLRKRMTIRVGDYAGEHLLDVEPDPGAIDLNDLPRSFHDGVHGLADPELVERITSGLNNARSTPPDVITTALSVLLFHADSVALVLPGDDFVDHLETYPEWISEADRTKDREPPERYLATYEQIYGEHSADTDVFFLVTMADMFLEGESLNPEYYRFRRRVVEHIATSSVEFNLGDEFGIDFENTTHRQGLWGTIDDVKRIVSTSPFAPVFLTPDTDSETDGFEPALQEPNYPTYPVWGLEPLLRRFRW
ncbi:MAG: hypothetical protein ABEJ60_04695 [Halodesulfurarchaeum sp.]